MTGGTNNAGSLLVGYGDRFGSPSTAVFGAVGRRRSTSPKSTATASLFSNAVVQLDGAANFNVAMGAQLTIGGDPSPPAGLTAAPAVLTNFSYTSGAYLTAGSLTKSGAGTLILSAASTYSGGTTVSAGTLRVNNTTGFGHRQRRGGRRQHRDLGRQWHDHRRGDDQQRRRAGAWQRGGRHVDGERADARGRLAAQL